MKPTINELLIVSGYETLMGNIRYVCKNMGINPPIIEWEQANQALVVTLATLFEKSGRPDVIISRGAVAEFIERSFSNIVVLRAEPDDVDLLEVLAEAKHIGSRVGFLVYTPHAFAFKTEVVRRIVGLDELRIYPVTSKRDIQCMIAKGRHDGMQVMVGGGKLGKRTGEAMEFPVLFAETSKRSIRNAIEQALSIIEARRGEKRQLTSLKAVMASVQEGIMTIRGNRVTLTNNVLATMLQLTREKFLGQNGAEFGGVEFGVAEIDPALQRFLEHEHISEEILQIKNQTLFCKKIPLSDAPVPAASEGADLMLICRKVTEIQQQERKIRRELHSKGFTARFHFTDIIGQSDALTTLIAKARTFAHTGANIFIHGESGTGKELFAQSIHNASERKNRPFVAVNCAAIPETLLESELFGYEEGAFSGAKRSGKVGLFELAHEGTIFLDEIDSLPIGLQGVLLRVIQEKEVRRVGSQSIISIDARIISATNSNLQQRIEDNAFRPDLYYRLNMLNLGLPPLTDRRDDILLLAEHFLSVYALKYKTSVPFFSETDKALILSHTWAGNVRELENVVHRYVILRTSGNTSTVKQCLDVSLVACARKKSSTKDGLVLSRGTLAQIEHEVILRYLEENKWNKELTADKLGICRATLWRKLKNNA